MYGIYGNIYHIPQMLAYIPYMDPMGNDASNRCVEPSAKSERGSDLKLFAHGFRTGSSLTFTEDSEVGMSVISCWNLRTFQSEMGENGLNDINDLA